MKAPIARKEAKITKLHGYELQDDYFWMRDRAKKKAPEILQHLTDENEYTDEQMLSSKKLEEEIYNEIIGRIEQTDMSVPYKKGNYWYATKTIEGKQYPIYVRSKTFDGKDLETILDQNELAGEFEFFSLSGLSVSDNGKLAAYLIDTVGYRQYTLQIKNLETGEFLPNEMARVTSFTWAGDGNTIYLTTEEEISKRSNKFFRHDVAANTFTEIYEEEDVLCNIFCGRSRDGRMIFLDSAAKTMDEWHYLDTHADSPKLTLIEPKKLGHEYSVDYYDGDFYIITNWQARNFRAVVTPISATTKENWKDFVPAREDVTLEGLDFYKGFAVISERIDGLEKIRIYDFKRGTSRDIQTEESVYMLSLIGLPEFESTSIRYSYSSMITPNSTYEYNLVTGETKLLKQQKVLGGYDKNDYETVRLWAKGRDGTKIPISLMMKKGVPIDGSAPLHLYAYGSYGHSIPPYFSVSRLSLVDRGVIYAIAHIRGGGDLGEKWRQDGRMFKKLNTFYDFIDCAKWLQKEKYTSPEKTTIEGGSAGGLLMGGVANMSPETFRAAVVVVPFVDVINTMLDESLPLTTEEWIEWGNPNKKEAFEYMLKYSPYENVCAQNYPNMLIEIALWDSQVPYWEGAKFAAKVRDLSTNEPEILLKTNMGGGHGGSSGRYERFREVAFEYAYVLRQVGIST